MSGKEHRTLDQKELDSNLSLPLPSQVTSGEVP